jgi:beta-N-acetylhexosaminidase
MPNHNLLNQIAHNKKIFKPVIYGFQGTELTDEEKIFFSKNSCIGFILFARNIVDKTQLKKLTNSLRQIMDGEVLILIDQEGGRVARLQPPIWSSYPSGKYFADLYHQNPELALQEIFNNFINIANDLNEAGINTNCAPILDILTSKTHAIIGDRAYGDNAKQVIELAKKVCEAQLSKNIFPVIKHIPGHGLGSSDSHLELPIVENSLEYLEANDFLPFRALNHHKFAMTAHILYSALDPDNCGTISPKVIDIIRNKIGFKNILMSDDLSMKALRGDFKNRTQKTLNAGCDLILHCNGDMSEMQEINSVLPIFDDNFRHKLTQ